MGIEFDLENEMKRRNSVNKKFVDAPIAG